MDHRNTSHLGYLLAVTRISRGFYRERFCLLVFCCDWCSTKDSQHRCSLGFSDPNWALRPDPNRCGNSDGAHIGARAPFGTLESTRIAISTDLAPHTADK